MTSDEASRALSWPQEWVRSETFWREVATRTAAGVLAGVILAGLGGLGVAIATPPSNQIGIISLMIFQLSLVVLSALLSMYSGVRLIQKRRSAMSRPYFARSFIYAVVSFTIFVALLIWSLTSLR
jgi:hypothetical protein